MPSYTGNNRRGCQKVLEKLVEGLQEGSFLVALLVKLFGMFAAISGIISLPKFFQS